MKLTNKDITEKKLRLLPDRKPPVKLPRESPSRKQKSTRQDDINEVESTHCPNNLWEEIAIIFGHDEFLTVKMSGQTAKYTQGQSDIEWFCQLAPRKAAAILVERFNAYPQDIIFISEGDKMKDSKIEDCVESGVAATISQTMIIVQKHMDNQREFVKAQFHCMVWGACNDSIAKLSSIFGKNRILGSSQRKFSTPPNITKVWPGIEKCRAIKYAGSHFEATWAADVTFRIEGARPLSDTALSFYGPRRCGQDFFIRPTHTMISAAFRYITDRSSSSA